MAKAADYIEDVKRYDAGANEDRVQKIVNYLGVALMNKDASLVACSDDAERQRIIVGYAAKKLGQDEAAATAAVEAVCQTMKGDRNKQRVTFYYLMAKNAGKLADL